jgi:hypothetical protein
MGESNVMFVQMGVGSDSPRLASAHGLDCVGVFDIARNVHACFAQVAGSPLPVVGEHGVTCASWDRAGCGPLTTTAMPSPPPSIDPLIDTVISAQTMTFEECAASLPANGMPKTIDRPLEWIHIPKCGTSFGATIYGYLCVATETPHTNPADTTVNCTYCGEVGKGLNRGLYWDPKLRNMIPFSNLLRRDGSQHRFSKYHAPYCDWSQRPHPPYSNHFALSNHEKDVGKTAVLTMLRDPRRRLVSAWNNDKHSYGVGRRDTVKYLQNISAFVQHPAIKSCQTKMMVGRVCADGRSITDVQLKQAMVKLEHTLAFVGLTDAFNASICLFHHMHGGLPQPYMFETVGGLRSSKFLVTGYKKSKKYKPLPGGGERVVPEAWRDIDPLDDPMDTRLYAFARGLFIRRLDQYGLLKA